eukprot:1082852-Alexandrium_andersonii.AAC.1
MNIDGRLQGPAESALPPLELGAPRASTLLRRSRCNPLLTALGNVADLNTSMLSCLSDRPVERA